MGGILAVVSHPDDETFGCGGALAFHAARGDQVTVLCLTCNPKNRHAEITNACKTLGVQNLTVLEEDNVLADRGYVKRISDIIVKERPEVIITHLPNDYHVEHRATYDAVKEAVEWAAHTTTYEDPWQTKKLLLMEINTLISSPHILLNIDGSMEKKMKAVDCYTTQLEKFPWGYYTNFTKKKAELRGSQAGCTYAEAYLQEPLTQNSPFYEEKYSRSIL